MPIITDQERNILVGGPLALAASSAALALALGIDAFDHMAFSASLCGGTTEHCSACFAALASLAVAVISGGVSVAVFRAYRTSGVAA
ncbi:hypothetical protein [Brevundimonas sp.]|jgi:hypothetical protein|uniref:hypothetical protein n=1 Tax=Brevundimonas sp. TaxID=1871086 RepID=UPI003784BD66